MRGGDLKRPVVPCRCEHAIFVMEEYDGRVSGAVLEECEWIPERGSCPWIAFSSQLSLIPPIKAAVNE